MRSDGGDNNGDSIEMLRGPELGFIYKKLSMAVDTCNF